LIAVRRPAYPTANGEPTGRGDAERDEVVADLRAHGDERGRAREDALGESERTFLPRPEIAAQDVAVERVDADLRLPRRERGDPPDRPCLRRVRVQDIRAALAQNPSHRDDRRPLVRPELPPQRVDVDRRHVSLAGEVCHRLLALGDTPVDDEHVVPAA
jgi:hypothetical protein